MVGTGPKPVSGSARRKIRSEQTDTEPSNTRFPVGWRNRARCARPCHRTEVTGPDRTCRAVAQVVPKRREPQTQPATHRSVTDLPECLAGARGQNRTDDLIFTRDLLCQLSYSGAAQPSVGRRNCRTRRRLPRAELRPASMERRTLAVAVILEWSPWTPRREPARGVVGRAARSEGRQSGRVDKQTTCRSTTGRRLHRS